MKGKDIEESIILKLIVSPFVGVYGFFVIRGGCALFSVSLISWEQRKLGSVFEEYSEKNHEELPPLTIIQGGGTVLREESDRALQYDKTNLSGYKMVRKDDFIVHLRTFEGGLEKAHTNGIISPAYHTFHGENTDSRFYYSFFRSRRFIDVLLKPHVYGIRDGKSIDIEGMKTIKIPVPIYDEQKRIGDYFESIDRLITLHQSKLFEHNKKKTCQFMISWEQRKFSDIYEKNNERNNGQFGWNRTISTSTMTFNEIGNGAADSSIDNYKILRVGDIAFEGHTNKEFRYGRFVLNDIGDGIMSPRFATLRPIIKQDLSFWKPYIHDERVMRKKLVRSTKAGTMMNELVIDDLMEQLILVPSLQEQKKIGAFFEGLDNLITLHQSKLSYYRNRSIWYGSF